MKEGLLLSPDELKKAGPCADAEFLRADVG